MNRNPMEECPPDDPQASITITAKLEGGKWMVRCPEWKCFLTSDSLTRAVAILCAEIESHNDECEGKPPIHKDYNLWADANGFARLRPEAWPKAPKKLRGTHKPIPDDGKRTRGDWWQLPT